MHGGAKGGYSVRISIVIPTWNQWAVTERCLQALARHTPQPHEVIVVDNGSTDGTPEMLRSRFPAVRLVQNPVNVGFPRAANQGLRAASGDLLVLLNNDTVVTPRWLTCLIRCLEEAPQAGLVGPVSNAVSGVQQVSVAYASLADMEAFATRFNGPDPSRWRQTVRLAGFCLLLSRRLYGSVGPLDEAFGLGNYEDDDYCLRAIAAGYRVWVAGDVFVHHDGSASFRLDGDRYRRLLARNRALFLRKHGLRRYRWNPDPHLAAWLPGSPRRVVDVGCGLGASGLELMRRGVPEVWGVTWDPAEARIAGRLLHRVVLVPDRRAVPPREIGPFAAAVVSGGLDEFPDPVALVARVVDLLEPGAPLVVQVLNEGHFSSPRFRPYLPAGLPAPEEGVEGVPVRRFRLEEFLGTLLRLGLEGIEVGTVHSPPPVPVESAVRSVATQVARPGESPEQAYADLCTWRFVVRGRKP